MVIEITKRYIIGESTLQSIVNSFIEQHYDESENIYKDEFIGDNDNFTEWLNEEMQIYYYDEIIYNNDVYKLKEFCEKSLKLEIEKEKILS